MVLVRIIPIDKHLVIKNIRSVCEDSELTDLLDFATSSYHFLYKRFCTYRDAHEFKPASKRTINESYLLASVSHPIDAVNRNFGDTLSMRIQDFRKSSASFRSAAF